MNRENRQMLNSKENWVVSGIIPCFNGESFIGEAIRRLLNQTRPLDELIVIDDGSKDNSLSIIRSFPEVRLIQHDTNLGLPTGRNNAWKAARGDIIIYVDVDAYAAPDYVENILKEYDDDKVGGVGGAGYEAHASPAPNRWRQLFLSQNYGDKPKDDVIFLFGIGASFRRSVLEEVGGFDPIFTTNGEDVDICIRIRKLGYRLKYAPSATLLHHRNDSWRSLRAMIYRWWFWGHVAHMKNQVPGYLMEHIKITLRMMRYITIYAIRHMKPRLMVLNLLFFYEALRAILMARVRGLRALEKRRTV